MTLRDLVFHQSFRVVCSGALRLAGRSQPLEFAVRAATFCGPLLPAYLDDPIVLGPSDFGLDLEALRAR